MGWLERQADLQRTYAGNAVPMEGTALSEYVRWNALALIKEVGEALDHVSWKTWTTNEPFLNRADYVGELVDVQIFLGNLLAAVGVTTGEFESAVATKQARVIQRFQSNRYEQRRVGQ
jgi:hypothetical protein